MLLFGDGWCRDFPSLHKALPCFLFGCWHDKQISDQLHENILKVFGILIGEIEKIWIFIGVSTLITRFLDHIGVIRKIFGDRYSVIGLANNLAQFIGKITWFRPQNISSDYLKCSSEHSGSGNMGICVHSTNSLFVSCT